MIQPAMLPVPGHAQKLRALSKRGRYIVGVGVAVVVAIAAVVSSRGPGSRVHDRAAARPPQLPNRRRRRLGYKANAVCRLGRKLYPNISLSAFGDTDTIDYAISRLVTEITAIAAPRPDSGGQVLELQGRPRSCGPPRRSRRPRV